MSYYLSIFRRRLPYFLIVATIISAIAVTVAYTLPPAYVSRMVLLVESAQIPEELASSTVRTPAFEQLQVMQQRLLTRQNMLDIARRHDVLTDVSGMNPDEIVDAMRARTEISTSNRRLKEAPLMTLTFEAPSARAAAEVLNEYLVLIQRQDSEFRKGRSGDTLEFFTQEVQRLGQELEAQSLRILKFKQANTEALPDSLEFRMSQLADIQDRSSRTDLGLSDLKGQRDRLIQLYQATGEVQQSTGQPLSPEQEQLNALRNQLDDALVIYSAENPRVKLLEARIAQLEAKLESLAVTNVSPPTDDSDVTPQLPTALTIQLSEIDSRIIILERQLESLDTQIADLKDSISKTPEVSITLEELDRKYDSIEQQFNQAEVRLSKASTGDRIESRSRGQRIAVIEQPAIPTQPTKPNRILIAGGGTAFGILAGLGLIILMEVLNTSARRPEDIISRLGITPLTTIPYIRTRGQRYRQRSAKILLSLAILIGIPAAVYAIHTFYLPLDLLADRFMNKIGVRW